MSTLIEARQLTKRFGTRTVLRGINLRVERGEFVALLGPNGAGKTTLLRVLSSLARPTHGSLVVAGCSLPRQAGELRRRLGVVSHHPMLYPELNAEENLAFYGRLYSLPDSPGRVLDVLEMVGLDPLRKDPVRTFSRGMLQRLAIGRAILHDPEVMLLDEPHSGLDQAACGMLNQALSRVAGSGRTILMATHDLLRADELASRFDVLSRGDLLASTDRAGLDLYGGLYAFYQAALS